MILSLIGIDYKDTPLSTREHIYSLRKELILFWENTGCETATLSTCNRIEFYLIFKDIYLFKKAMYLFKNTFSEICGSFYLKQGRDKLVRHALRISCGLESQLIGEKEILLQLRSWINQDHFPYMLKEIWSVILMKAEDIRIRSGLNEIRENISRFVFKDLTQQMGISLKKEILVIGTGKVAKLFSENKLPSCDICFAARKKHNKALKLAKKSNSKAILLDELAPIILKVDAIVSATASPHYILRKKELARIALKRSKPLYIYDLAVPRDVEPGAGDIKGVFLKDMDGLALFFKLHKERLAYKIKLAEISINEYMDNYKEAIDADFREGRYASKQTCVKTG